MTYTVEFPLSEEQANRLAEMAVAMEDEPEALFVFLMKVGSEAVIDRALALGERMAACRVR